MGRAPCCDKTNVKKGQWSPEEDAKLKEYIEKHGIGGNWIALPQKAGLKRCGKSCRLRWLNYLRPNIKHGDFSEEEDIIICNLFASIGSRWSIIASQLPGRTDNDIKNHWNTKLKKRLMARASSQRNYSTTMLSAIYNEFEGNNYSRDCKNFELDPFSKASNSHFMLYPTQEGLMDPLEKEKNMLVFGGEARCSSTSVNYGIGEIKQEEIVFEGHYNGHNQQKFMLNYGGNQCHGINGDTFVNFQSSDVNLLINTSVQLNNLILDRGNVPDKYAHLP